MSIWSLSSPAAEQAIAAEMARNTVVWSTRPLARRAFWRWSLVWPFTVPWIVGLTSIVLVASPAPGPQWHAVIALLIFVPVFIGVPLYATLLPILQARRTARTAIVLTTDSILQIVATRAGTIDVTTTPIDGIQRFSRLQGPGGSGRLELSLDDWALIKTSSDDPPTWQQTTINLEHVPDTREAEARIEAAQIERARTLGRVPALQAGP
jgi:hypothetical protein